MSPASGPSVPLGHTVRNSGDEDASAAERPPRKRRKQRPQFSCSECRRLKLKCDRKVPCANCERRSCIHLCPSGPQPEARTSSKAVLSRLEVLEGLLTRHGLTVPPESDEQPEQSGLGRSEVGTTGQPTAPTTPPLPPQPPMAAVTAGTTIILRANNGPPSISPASRGEGVPHIPSQTAIEPTVIAYPRDTSDTQWQPPQGAETISPFSFSGGPTFQRPETAHVHFDFNPPSTVASSGHVGQSVQQASPDPQSFGTLVLTHGGRSKWLGPTAASEWLKDQEFHEAVESPNYSRMPSPERRLDQNHPPPSVFPFGASYVPMSTATLLARLPPVDEGSVLVNSYYRYFAWHYDIAPLETLQPIFQRIYSIQHSLPSQASFKVIPSELALLFIVFAMGALHNLELPPNDPSAEDFCSLAKSCLVKGDFMANTTVAGVQTLHIMAHYVLETEKGRNGDSAWPLWGLATRLIQAMGLHRDGARWNLTEEVVEERRRVMWESYSADIFQANCFSRPASMSLDYIDTALPAEPASAPHGYFRLKFELARISSCILDFAMKVTAPSYTTLSVLHQRLCEFERHLPYHLRCRAALLAIPSAYSDPEQAIRDSPGVVRSNLTLTFQQYTLAINISETILFLHRPYYARALHDQVQDPTKSQFGASYLAVVERCHVIISSVASLYAIHPNVCARHWFLWYHTFNSAVCLSTLILKNPQNALASFALSQIDSAIYLYTSAVQAGSSRRTVSNLRWLLRLRAQADKKMHQVSVARSQSADNGATTDSEDDIELIGWRTRLIQRVSQGAQTAQTIAQTGGRGTSAATESPATDVNDTILQALQHQLLGDFAQPSIPESNQPTQPSTDELFWDPMMLPEFLESTQDSAVAVPWWDRDNTLDEGSGVGNHSETI
ncbi:hypothetical protein IAU60_002548 [Kwoniella sp. DSM 27419]